MYKVLIVDDAEITRIELKRLHIWGEKTGFEIAAEARNGQEALEQLKSDTIDLVITDIKMPKIDGLELLRKIKELQLCTCVVLLSDYADFSYARQGMVSGAFDYLSKPVSTDELLSLLNRVSTELEDRQKESQRLKMLEEKLEEKVELFYPAAEVSDMIGLILDGDARAPEQAARIFDFSVAYLGQDMIRMEFLLKSILMEVARNVLEQKNWLKAFLKQSELAETGDLQCGDAAEIKIRFTKRIESLCRLIRRFECSEAENETVRKICSFILEHVDDDLSVRLIAEKFFMSRTYLSEIFKLKSGMQLVEFLTMVKMERAKVLLSDGKLKNYEIAEKLGFKDIEYFSRLFKRYTGMPPVEFRQIIRAG